MPEKNIIFQLKEDHISPTTLYPLYRSKSGGNIMSLKVDLYIPSYSLVPWPEELSVENTEDLNNAIIARDEFDNAQIYLHFFVGDERESISRFLPPGTRQEFWYFLRTCAIVNRGVPLFIDVLKPYVSGVLGYLPFQKGERLGIFWESPGGNLQANDWVNILGQVEESLLPEEEQDDSPFLGIEMLFEGYI